MEREVLPRFGLRRQDNAQKLMRYLYRKPIVDAKMVSTLLEVTPNTSNAFIAELIERKVLSEMTGQRRNRLYMFQEYIELFSREAR